MKSSVPLSVILEEAIRSLGDSGLESPRMEARVLAIGILNLSREQMLAQPDQEISPDDQNTFVDAVRRRASREPAARIIGNKEFWSLPIFLGPETLIPRPETETVVETVLELVPDRDREWTILDLGTGSGCLVCALLSEFPHAQALGIDCAEGAVSVATGNAQRSGFGDRAAFQTGDWGKGLKGPFDIIVSNPPYIASGEICGLQPDVKDFDPRLALVAGDDGLDAYRAIAPYIAELLAPDGVAVLELGAGQRPKVAELLNQAGLETGSARQDLAGHERALPAAFQEIRLEKKNLKKKVGKRCIPV